jgi:hypothetical protein
MGGAKTSLPILDPQSDQDAGRFLPPPTRTSPLTWGQASCLSGSGLQFTGRLEARRHVRAQQVRFARATGRRHPTI